MLGLLNRQPPSANDRHVHRPAAGPTMSRNEPKLANIRGNLEEATCKDGFPGFKLNAQR
jgi:hypothetical protein